MVWLQKIVLTNFRNFTSKKIDFSKSLILLSGANGVGKTNILEALTLLGRGPNLRGSDMSEMLYKNSNSQEKSPQFGIYSQVQDHQFIDQIGLSFELEKKKKTLKINDEIINNKRQSDAKNYFINFIALTPKLEQLFILGKSERRDYLDKIVSDIDSSHISRVNNYQKLLKERLLILQKYGLNDTASKWLNVIEVKIVELGMAIAFARIEAIDFFNRAIASFESNFPKVKLCAIGEIEKMIESQNAIAIEKFYQDKLKENRSIDLANFKTNFGVHRGDFDAIFLNKNTSALNSSTGEQKAIMIGITLARANISANYKNQPTILIFDEVVSHLDEKRKENLFLEIKATKLQTFFSATTPNLIPKEYIKNNEIEVVEL